MPQLRESDPRGRRPPASPFRARAAALVTLVAVAVIGAGCGGDDAPAGGRSASDGGEVSVSSCGRSVSVRAAPRWVVIAGAGLADTLFALGVGDRISGVSSASSTPAPAYRRQLSELPSVGDPDLGREALIAGEPDLVIAEQEHRVSGARGTPTIEQLDTAGIAAYVAASGCGDTGTDRATVADLFTDIGSYGRIFGIPDRARALVEQLEDRLGSVERAIAGRRKVRVAALSQVGGEIYAATGGASHDTIARAGAENVFADLPGGFTPVSAEQVTKRNPQALILQEFELSPASLRKGTEFLQRTFPTTDAVKNGRVLAIDASKAGNASSTRVVTGIAEIARFLHPDAFPPSSSR